MMTLAFLVWESNYILMHRAKSRKRGATEVRGHANYAEFLLTDHSGSKHRSTETTGGASGAQSRAPLTPKRNSLKQSPLCPLLAYQNA